MKKVLFTLIALLVCLACVSVASALTVEEGAVVAYGDLTEITAVGDHEVTNFVIVKEPTCTENGVARFDCAAPGVHADTTTYHVVAIKARGHKWSSEVDPYNWGKVVKEPTCTENGLAIDVCTVCGAEDPNHTREIWTAHVYDEKHYDVVYNPTCIEYGWAIPTCIYCGQQNPEVAAWWNNAVANKLWGEIIDNGEANGLIKLAMVDHKWTEWNNDPAVSCSTNGAHWRACEWCGALQLLDADHPVVLDHGKELKLTELFPKLNEKWDDEFADIKDATFDSENALKAAFAKVKTCKYEVKKDWLKDCYTREITLQCPYCKGKVHDDVTYTLVYPMVAAHAYVLQEAYSDASDYDLTSAELLAALPEVSDWESVDPSCEKDGFELYLCVHDEKCDWWEKEEPYNVHTSPAANGDKAYYKVAIPATGHNWDDWAIVDSFKNEAGEEVVLRVRTCKTCFKVENEVIKKDAIPADPEPFTGLKKEDDGKWYYYVKGEFKDTTGFVTFQGGEFWVTDGVVDTSLNGLVNCPGDKWLFFSQGQVQRVTQLATYAGKGFMVKNGELDVNANGLYDVDGVKVAFAAGRWLTEVNGIWQNPKDGVWYFLAEGRVQNYTGTATYDGASFELVNGVLVK